MTKEQTQKRVVKSLYFGDYVSYTYKASMLYKGGLLVGFGHTHYQAITNLINQL